MRRIVTSILLAIGAIVPASAQAGKPPYANLTFTLPATGTGLAYASDCASEHWLYTSASSVHLSRYQFTGTDSYTYDGSSIRVDTFYKDATTLCDGKPRVSSSPATPLSTRTTTVRTGNPTTKVYTITQFSGRLLPSPSCSIKPDDCDPLWADFSRSLGVSAPQITPGPRVPPCWNSSFASSEAAFQSSFYGCGKCTIFGEGVQLVYFPVPTTVSRDMCATTPAANLTHYGSGAVITAYAGTRYSGMDKPNAGQRTAVINGHTFTSGTAYISLASVWASDRCSSTHGSVVTDAILAMPSESVLSLRYTQNHAEYYFDQTVSQTGYPVSYADFNEPVPYSAWNGQSTCRAADDGYSCQTIYEGMYRPQLAIPPGIRDLSPDFEGCAFWYKGLYDPPLALTEAASEAIPSPPGHQDGNEATAMQSATAVATGPVLISETQQWRPGSRPQTQIAEPTSTSQDLRHGSGQHENGLNSGSSHNGADDGNDSNDNSKSGSIGNTGPSEGSGEPSESLMGDEYTTPGLHQGAASPTYNGMDSSRHENEATTDSQVDVQNHGDAQGRVSTHTRTGGETARPGEQHSGSIAAIQMGTEVQSGKLTSTVATTSNGNALDQPTQQSEKVTKSIHGTDSDAPLTSKPVSSMNKLQPTGQTTAFSSMSRSSSISSPRDAPPTHFLLFLITVAVQFQMTWPAG